MKLSAPFIQLPLHFDAAVLADEVHALGEAPWKPHPQGFAGNSMLPLVAVDGDPDNEAFAGPMAPTPALAACPYLQQVFAAVGATIGRSRLMRLSGQAEVTRHVDQGYYWVERVRIHVPIVTQPTVRFDCGDETVNMAAGECWIFDTWRQHRVLNDADRPRIHLVIDTVGGSRFWDLVAAGRASAHKGGPWQAVPMPPSSVAPVFPCETVNVPVVMSPWEMRAHFDLLFADTLPHPALPRLRMLTSRFQHAWRGLWFRYGDAIETRSHYAPVLKAYIEEARVLAQGVMLANEIRWLNAMMTMVARFAAGELGGGGRPMA